MLSACLARPSAAGVGSSFAAAPRSLARPSTLAQRRPQQRQLSSDGIRPSAATEAAEAAAAAAAPAAPSSSSSSSSGSSSSSSSSNGHVAAPPTPAQAAAADRLLELSRSYRQRAGHVSDSELQKRIALLLQLDFSEAAIQKHIEHHNGGPYVAWGTVAELVALLQQEGLSQEQLDKIISSGGSDSTFSRAPADVAANLRWLREAFGLSPAEAARTCSRAPGLLVYGVETLQDNWAAVVKRWQLPDTAMAGVAYSLRGGHAKFALLTQEKVRDKTAALQALLGLTDAQVAARFGKLAVLLSRDIAGLEQRVQLLLKLTGLPLRKLAMRILVCNSLLTTSEKALQRNHDAILKAVGDEATAKLLISRRPDVLASGTKRVAGNLQTLRARPFSCSATAAVDVLLKNARLAVLDLEQPSFAARVAYWQQAYACANPEVAMLKCSDLLHRNLRTVAPRVAYWQSQHPARALPAGTATFTRSDGKFCEQRGLDPADFQAFKRRWLASEEGRAVCRHERGGGAAGGSE